MQSTELQLVLTAQNKASAELQRLSGDVDRLTGRVGTSEKSMRNMLKTIGGLTAVYGAVKVGIMGSIQAFNESALIEKKLEVITMNLKGQTMEHVNMLKEQAKALSMVGVMGDDVVMSAQAQLATFDLTAESIRQVTPALMDMIVAEKGIYASSEDAKASAQGLGKAFQGQFDVLKKQGFIITQAQEKMIKFGNESMKVKAITEILGTTYADANKKMLDTFAGRVQWMKNQAGELQEAFGSGLTKGLTDAFTQGITGMDNFQARTEALQVYMRAFGASLIGGFTFVFRSLYNLVQIVAKTIAKPFQYAYAQAKDAVQTFKNIVDGDFSIATDNFTKAVEDSQVSIGQDVLDMQEGFENAFMSVEGAINDTSSSLGQLPPAMGAVGGASEEMAKKIEDASKKINTLKKEMKEAIKSAKQDIKDFKKEFADQELSKQKDFNNSVAEIIVNKQKEIAGFKSEMGKAETDEEKKKLEEQIKTVQAFLDAHLADQKQYASEIQKVKDFQAMDEIDQLKFTFAEEKKIRQADYEDQLKDLKKHLKSVEKEYKDKLSDLRKELKEQLGDITITVDVDKKKKRALGGAVMAGQSYIVGEHRPEVFTPSQNGNISPSVPSGGVGGSSLVVNINNPPSNMDVRAVIDMVERALNRKQELTRLGAI